MITCCQTLIKEVSSKDELTPFDLIAQLAIMLKQKLNRKDLTRAEQDRIYTLYKKCKKWENVDTQFIEE